MNWIDIIVLVILLPLALKGYRDGLIRQLTVLLALVIAVVFCTSLAHFFQQYLAEIFKSHSKSVWILSVVISFGAILYIIKKIGFMGKNIVRRTPFEFIDKLAGMVLAPAIILVLMSYLFLFIDSINPINKTASENDARVTSTFYIPISRIATIYMPKAFKEIPLNEFELPKLEDAKKLLDSTRLVGPNT